jgi:hypothetical protein
VGAKVGANASCVGCYWGAEVRAKVGIHGGNAKFRALCPRGELLLAPSRLSIAEFHAPNERSANTIGALAKGDVTLGCGGEAAPGDEDFKLRSVVTTASTSGALQVCDRWLVLLLL